MIYLAWAFGICGTVANVLIFQQKNRNRLIITKLIADCLWGAHYCCLTAWSGAAVCVVGAVRELVFRKLDYKSRKGKVWLAVFLVCSALTAVLTWESVFSVLPAFGAIVCVVSFWIGNPRLASWLQIPISGAFLAYNIRYVSYIAILSDTITLLSIFITLYVYEVRKKRV